MSSDLILFPPLHFWPPPEPAGGWALPPGVSLIGKLPGVLEDENMRADRDGTLFAREHRETEEMARELNITFGKPPLEAAQE